MLEKVRQYALIGENLSYSISKEVHKTLFSLNRIMANYEYAEIKLQNFENNLENLKNLDGFNVTIPYKQKIIPYLTSVSEDVELMEAVNTVKNINGKLIGYNTDAVGFISSLKYLNTLLPASFCVIGCGATARTLAIELANSGAKRIVIAVRNKNSQNLEKTKKLLMNSSQELQVEIKHIDELNGNVDMLINATPVGTFPDNLACPIDKVALHNVKFVYDLVYNPPETMLIKMAKEQNIKVANGLYMLVWQAALAHRVWYGARFDRSEIDRLIKRLQKKF